MRSNVGKVHYDLDSYANPTRVIATTLRAVRGSWHYWVSEDGREFKTNGRGLQSTEGPEHAVRMAIVYESSSLHFCIEPAKAFERLRVLFRLYDQLQEVGT